MGEFPSRPVRTTISTAYLADQWETQALLGNVKRYDEEEAAFLGAPFIDNDDVVSHLLSRAPVCDAGSARANFVLITVANLLRLLEL